MEYIQTIKRFVAGSNKYFDIYKCTVDEVERYQSAAGKDMVRIKVEGKEYTGLYNRVVYDDFLCANEGQESFVVFWKAPKGDPMVAYVKDLWIEYRDGTLTVEPSVSQEDAFKTEGESFVYMWINKDNDKKYIGKHRGLPDDGYVASSESLLAEYNESPSRFIRTILAYGSDQEMLELETILLLNLKTRMSPLYYNMSNNLKGGKYG